MGTVAMTGYTTEHAVKMRGGGGIGGGTTMLITSDFVNRGADGDYAGRVTLDSAADALTIDLLDRNGLIVHSESMATTSSCVAFCWDGTVGDKGGSARMVSGPLRVRVSAQRKGRAVPTITSVWRAGQDFRGYGSA
jgi:flagellar basal-body rod modification protein FlgD